MAIIDYHKCLAFKRNWLSPKSTTNRIEYALIILERHPEPKDWDCICFSDKVYFGWDTQHQLQIICKPGKQYCIDCIQYREKL